MIDILDLIPSKKKKTQNGWYSFNCPFCIHMGHNSDKRSRGGLIFENDTDWVYHCFNCNLKARFKVGSMISGNTRKMLSWLGCDTEDIQKLNIESLKYAGALRFLPEKKKINITFKDVELPNAELLNESNPDHAIYVKYLRDTRGIDVNSYPFLVTPYDKGRNKNSIIVPYTYDNRIVGYTIKYFDNKMPKYINNHQVGYVFGADLQKEKSSICIVTEGVFDALSIGGCAILHDDINDEQAYILSKINKKIIYVPHIDRPGLNVCERALSLGYNISIPSWEPDIKDINEAVVRYGKVATLYSIVQNIYRNMIPVKIKMNSLIEKRTNNVRL